MPIGDGQQNPWDSYTVDPLCLDSHEEWIMSRGCHLQLLRHLRSACERAREKLSFLWQGLASGRVEVSLISDQWQLAILLICNYLFIYIYIPFVYQELYAISVSDSDFCIKKGNLGSFGG